MNLSHNLDHQSWNAGGAANNAMKIHLKKRNFGSTSSALTTSCSVPGFLLSACRSSLASW